MKGQFVVKRYARALCEVAGNASLLDSVEEDIGILNRLLTEAPEIRQYCLSSSQSPEKNRKFIDIVFLPYLSELSGRTVEILCRNNRLEALPYLGESLQKEIDRYRGITKVQVESASELDDPEKDRIRSVLEKRIDGPIRVDWHVCRDLQGGVTFQWDNRFWDLSLKSRLNSLKSVLKRNAL